MRANACSFRSALLAVLFLWTAAFGSPAAPPDTSRDGLVKCAFAVRDPVFFRGTANTNGLFVYPITFSATVRQPSIPSERTNSQGLVLFRTKTEQNRIRTSDIIRRAASGVVDPPATMRLVAFLDQQGNPTFTNVTNNGLVIVDANNLTNVVALVPSSLLQITPLSGQQRNGDFSQAMQLSGKAAAQTNFGTFTFTNAGAVTASMLILDTFPAFGAVPSREREFAFPFDNLTEGTNFVFTFGGSVSGTYED